MKKPSHLSDETVEPGVSQHVDLQVPAADVVHSLVVDQEGAV